MNQSKKFLFKIVVVGDGGIGKSTMIQRLITGKYIEQKITIGTDLASWGINLNDLTVKLQIWDFAGDASVSFYQTIPEVQMAVYSVMISQDIQVFKIFPNGTILLRTMLPIPDLYSLVESSI